MQPHAKYLRDRIERVIASNAARQPFCHAHVLARAWPRVALCDMRAVQLQAPVRTPAACKRLPPPCRRRRRCLAAAGSGDQQGSAADPQALLRRAAALRAQQEALEREAAQLAAALEGLPAAEQRAVLEALGAQRQAQQQAQQGGGSAGGQGLIDQQQQEQQQQQHHQQQQQQHHQQQQQQQGQEETSIPPPAGTSSPGELAPAAWEAGLPPALQQVIRDAGMQPTLRKHAQAVRAAVGEEGEATGAGSGERWRLVWQQRCSWAAFAGLGLMLCSRCGSYTAAVDHWNVTALSNIAWLLQPRRWRPLPAS